MTLVRRLARPMLASIFISGGIDALRNPESKAPTAEAVGPKVARKIPYLPEDTTQLVRINAATMIGAGSLLALGKLPRLSALALIGTLVPTTIAGHRFWEIEDSGQRAMQRVHFFKNLGVLGGLLLAVVDTEGRPGVAWRARHVTKDVRREAHLARKRAGIG